MRAQETGGLVRLILSVFVFGVIVVVALVGVLAVAVSVAVAEAVPGPLGDGLAAVCALGGVGFAVSLGVGVVLVATGTDRMLVNGHGLLRRRRMPGAPVSSSDPSGPRAREPDSVGGLGPGGRRPDGTPRVPGRSDTP